MNRIFIIAFTVLISGCSQYQFNSNLDKSNFDNYFKPSHVKIYEKQALLDLTYTTLGAVEGSSCQQAENDRPADIKEARTFARINAADMGANGIVFQACINFEKDESCFSNIICYGHALNITSVDK